MPYNDSSDSDSDQEKLQNDNNETNQTPNNSLLSKILDNDDQIDENSIPKVELKKAEKDVPNVKQNTHHFIDTETKLRTTHSHLTFFSL